MIEDIQIREFKREDLRFVKHLINETIDISYAGVYPEEANELFKEHHSEENILNDAETGYTIIIEFDGMIIGTGTLVGTNVRRVFIDPPYQYRGVGKSIIHELEEYALRQDITDLELYATPVSKQFWSSRGFILQEEVQIPLENNQKLSYYKMIKTALIPGN